MLREGFDNKSLKRNYHDPVTVDEVSSWKSDNYERVSRCGLNTEGLQPLVIGLLLLFGRAIVLFKLGYSQQLVDLSAEVVRYMCHSSRNCKWQGKRQIEAAQYGVSKGTG